MKKLICLLALAAVLVYIVGLRKNTEEKPLPSPEPSIEVTAVPTASPEPETPKFDFRGYTAQEVADYFCEVALGDEYTHGDGDSNALQKWKQPIYYSVYGSPSSEDTAIIEEFAVQLNEIEGFPGMYPAPSPAMENFVLRFLGREEMNQEASYVVYGEDAHGITLWDYYTDTNDIYNVRIWIRSDIDQHVRNSVILEEIVNSLGLGNDSLLRSDSIIYQLYSETQELSEMDWLLLELLYSDEIRCGMHEEHCREVINKMFE